MLKFKNWWSSFWNKVPTAEQTQASQKLAKKQIQPLNDGLFGFLFNRIEVIMLVVMGVMALTLHFFFVEYVERQANFLTADQDARFWFATRLVGSLLFLEITLALVTAFFRYRGEWDKSILTFLIAGIIAIFNQVTINEIFAELNGQNAIWGKMLLLNWLVFGIGESIGFVMHSKGTLPKSKILTFDDLQYFFNSPANVNKPNLYSPFGEILPQSNQDIDEIPEVSGFKRYRNKVSNQAGQKPNNDSTYKSSPLDDLSEDELREIIWANAEIANALGISIRNISLATGRKKADVHKRTKKAKEESQTKIFE